MYFQEFLNEAKDSSGKSKKDRIIELLKQKKSTKEIAKELNISNAYVNSVKSDYTIDKSNKAIDAMKQKGTLEHRYHLKASTPNSSKKHEISSNNIEEIKDKLREINKNRKHYKEPGSQDYHVIDKVEKKHINTEELLHPK